MKDSMLLMQEVVPVPDDVSTTCSTSSDHHIVKKHVVLTILMFAGTVRSRSLHRENGSLCRMSIPNMQ
jgi:hypothetical protein